MITHSKPPAAFYRDLAILLGEGYSLRKSLPEMASKSDSAKVRKFASAFSRIQANSNQELLDKCPFRLDLVAKEALLCEADSETVVSVLFAVAEGVETEDTFGKRVIIALAYPCAIFCLYLTLLSVVQLLVLPIFQEMFESFGSTLPMATRWILGYSEYIPLAVIVPVLLLIKPLRQALLKHLPLFRSIYQNADTMKATRSCLLLKQLIKDNDQALQLSLQPFGLQAGEDHQQFVLNKKLFNPLAWQAISNRQNPSGELLLNDLLCSLEHKHRNLIDRAAVVSQVVSMILIATLVGSLAFAVMAPIFELSSIVN